MIFNMINPSEGLENENLSNEMFNIIVNYFSLKRPKQLIKNVFIEKRKELIMMLNKLKLQRRLVFAHLLTRYFTIDIFTETINDVIEFFKIVKQIRLSPNITDNYEDYVKSLRSTIYLNSSIKKLSNLRKENFSEESKIINYSKNFKL